LLVGGMLSLPPTQPRRNPVKQCGQNSGWTQPATP